MAAPSTDTIILARYRRVTPYSPTVLRLRAHVLLDMFPARTILDPIIAIAAGVLFIAYLRTEYLAPVPTEVATLKYPHEFGFPAWFSKGPSPHDVVEEDLLRPGDPEERVLVLHGQSAYRGHGSALFSELAKDLACRP